MHRGGAPIRQRGNFYAANGDIFGQLPAANNNQTGGDPTGQALVQAVNRVESAVRDLPSRQGIYWDDSDTAQMESRLGEQQSICDDLST